MDPELKALLESPEFRRYHKELRSPRAFSPFDVLQVADREIRHSNVLAWLLAPNETHGIGSGFLRGLVEHLTRRHDFPSLRSLTGFDDKGNVEVTRKDYHEKLYADITVGFKAQSVLLVIENKLGASSPDAEEQVEAYREVLAKKYMGRYRYFPGVLLTTSTSPEGGDAERGFVHLGWKEVGGIIRDLLDDPKNFAGDYIRTFVEQYVEVIEERLIHAGDDLAERLKDDHRPILEKLQEEKLQGRTGRTGLLDQVDEPQHRDTIERWLEYFEGIPRKLREEVREYLTSSKRVGAGIRGTGRGAWLHWYETPPAGKDLGIGDCAWWWFSFEPRKVTLELGTPLERNPRNPKMQEIWSFLQDTPIDPDGPERYPMDPEHRVIYRHSLLKGDELSGPFEKTVKLLYDRLDEFFGPDGDYKRIERYFRCLAFDPRDRSSPTAPAGLSLRHPPHHSRSLAARLPGRHRDRGRGVNGRMDGCERRRSRTFNRPARCA